MNSGDLIVGAGPAVMSHSHKKVFMLRFTLTVERFRQSAGKQATHPPVPATRSIRSVLAFAYGALLVTSAVTDDQTMLVAFTRGFAAFVAKMVGFDLGH